MLDTDTYLQAQRGKKAGEAKRARTYKRDENILAMSIYGFSQKHIAEQHGISINQVGRIVRRMSSGEVDIHRRIVLSPDEY